EDAGVGGGGALGGGGCGRGHRWGFLVGAQASRPSSLSTRSRACGSASTLSMALRKAGALPRGPFRATSASRRAISFFSSGTCSTRLAGLKSFMESMRNCTARSSPASSRRRLGTLKVRFSSCLASTSSKLFLSMEMGLRSSILRSSARWVKSPSTISFNGSSCSSWALPVAGLKVTLMRSLGATEPSLAIASLLACSVQRRVEIEAAQAAVQRFLAFAQPLLLVAAMQLAGDGQGQARLPALQVVRLQLLIQRFEQRPGQLVAAGLTAQAGDAQLPVRPLAQAVGVPLAVPQVLRGGLEAVLAQQRLGLAQRGVPGGVVARAGGIGRGAWRRAQPLGDPGAGVRAGEGRAVVEAQVFQVRQPAQQDGQLAFHRLHGGLGAQRLGALPGQVLTVQPEGRARQAGFQLDQQFGGATLAQGVVEGVHPVARQAAQRGDLFGIAGRRRLDGQPQQAAGQAQGAGVGRVLAQPPVAQGARLFLQGAQLFLRVPVALRLAAGGRRGGGRDRRRRWRRNRGGGRGLARQALELPAQRQQGRGLIAQAVRQAVVESFEQIAQALAQRRVEGALWLAE